MVCKWYGCCPVRRNVEQGLVDRKWVDEYCLKDGEYKKCIRYKMEERGKSHPDNMLPDGSLVNL